MTRIDSIAAATSICISTTTRPASRSAWEIVARSQRTWKASAGELPRSASASHSCFIIASKRWRTRAHNSSFDGSNERSSPIARAARSTAPISRLAPAGR